MAKKFVKIVLLFVVSSAPVIIIPQLFDPVGLRYGDDIYTFITHFECANPDCTLYWLPPGTLRLQHGWSVTTGANGARRVPDNAPTCQVNIALIGDSFTWGPMVNDDETWGNLLARQFPDACFHIYAQWGFNSEQVALALTEIVPAETDYVLYFIFQNDNMEAYDPPRDPEAPASLHVVRYMELIGWKLGFDVGHEGWATDRPRYPDRFAATIQQLAADPRVHFVGFETELLVHAVRDMGYTVFGLPVPPRSQRMSPIDNHLNPAGHRNLAEHLAPLVQELLADFTPGRDADHTGR